MLAWIREKTSRAPVIIAAALTYVVSQILLVVMVQPLGTSAVYRLQSTLSGAELLAIITAWRDAGVLDIFSRHLIPDFFHPLWYTALFCCGITWALNRRGLSPRWNILFVVPMTAGVLDVAENIVQLSILRCLDEGPLCLADVSVILTFVKWLAVIFCMNLPAAVFFLGRRFGARP